MNVTDKKGNVFVVGDLVVDRAIFVHNKSTAQSVGNETVHEVLRRVTTAGGAANSARVLASLSLGRTFLWGVLGRSQWSTFRDILEHCHWLDSAMHSVQLRGVHDETDAAVTTIASS